MIARDMNRIVYFDLKLNLLQNGWWIHRVSRFRWRFFSNLELGFEIDKEFENDEVVISEEIGESEIVDESIFSILSSEKSSFMNLRMNSQKYFS